MKTIFSFVEDGEHILYDRYSNEFLSVEEAILNDVNNDLMMLIMINTTT